MMKFLVPSINWEEIQFVGFDLDGTLYDEFDFISQVYKPISGHFCENEKINHQEVYNWMLCRWLEKGSSYPFIFEETLDKFCTSSDKKVLIDCAITIFRNYKPKLRLSNKIHFILSHLKNNYILFIVTDGYSTTQCNKIKALKLDNYFPQKNIFISGDFGLNANKPGLLALETLEIFNHVIESNKIIFFGDREVDKLFAEGAGFRFIETKHLLFF